MVGSSGTRHAIRLQIEQFHQPGRGNLGLRGGLRQGVSPHGKFRLHRSASAWLPWPVRAKAAVSSASCFGVVERLLRNGLLLERPQKIEIGHSHEEEQVVGGGRGRVLLGRHLLARDARLENGVRQGELGRHAGNRRGTAAHRIHPQSGFQCRAAGRR